VWQFACSCLPQESMLGVGCSPPSVCCRNRRRRCVVSSSSLCCYCCCCCCCCCHHRRHCMLTSSLLCDVIVVVCWCRRGVVVVVVVVVIVCCRRQWEKKSTRAKNGICALYGCYRLIGKRHLQFNRVTCKLKTPKLQKFSSRQQFWNYHLHILVSRTYEPLQPWSR